MPGFRFACFWLHTGFAKRVPQPTILVAFAGGDGNESQGNPPFWKARSSLKIRLLEEALFLLFLSPLLFAASRASLGLPQKEGGKGRIVIKLPHTKSGEAGRKFFFRHTLGPGRSQVAWDLQKPMRFARKTCGFACFCCHFFANRAPAFEPVCPSKSSDRFSVALAPYQCSPSGPFAATSLQIVHRPLSRFAQASQATDFRWTWPLTNAAQVGPGGLRSCKNGGFA